MDVQKEVRNVNILKRILKDYTFFRSLFPLQSKSTLPSTLSIPPVRTGFNGHVFSKFKETVQTISDKDRVYFLVFCELSNRENLNSNHKLKARATEAAPQITL